MSSPISSCLIIIILCKWLTTDWWFSPCTPVSPTSKSWPPRYSWNIVECGVKHHNPNSLFNLDVMLLYLNKKYKNIIQLNVWMLLISEEYSVRSNLQLFISVWTRVHLYYIVYINIDWSCFSTLILYNII